MNGKYKAIRMEILEFLWEVKNGKITVKDHTGLGVQGTILYDRIHGEMDHDEFKTQLDYLEEKGFVVRKPIKTPNVETKKDELALSWYKITAPGADELEIEKKLIEHPIQNNRLVVNNTNKVFIVHGHNESVRNSVARFIEKLGLEAIILHEQPNKGRTIIEKFLDYSDVSFAIVLLTADDRGGVISQAYEQQRPRARQNVIFELGFFIGKLGRERVCAIYEETAEIPSDYQGVLFVPMDPRSEWQIKLAREMKAAGLCIDLNKVL